MAYRRGDRVDHSGFGPGKVRAVIDGGRKLRVVFDRFPGIPYVLPAAQFEAGVDAKPEVGGGRGPAARRKARHAAGRSPIAREGERPASRREEPPEQEGQAAPEVRAAVEVPVGAEPGAAPPAHDVRADARQLFEALRMGVVPPAMLDRYTVGRDEEIERIRRFIAGGKGILVMEGHYGSGKTHMIELALGEARAAGFATSRVSFDPVEVPPSNPLRIYREIIRNLAYPPDGTGGGLAPLLSRLQRSRPHRTAGNPAFHRYLSPALFAMAEGDKDTSDAVLEYVEGRGGTRGDRATRLLRACGWRGPGLLALPDWRTFSQVYLYILGGIAVWARDAGHRGLVVLFDEAESMDSLERTSRAFAETFLRYFAAATLPERELAFRVEDLYRGGHEVHRRIPHVYAADQPLAAIFAFTPLPSVSLAIDAALGGRRRVLELEPLAARDLPVLAERLVGLYGELHDRHALDAGARDRLLAHVRRAVRAGAIESTRGVARLAVEYLDLLRHRPEAAETALETAVEGAS